MSEDAKIKSVAAGALYDFLDDPKRLDDLDALVLLHGLSVGSRTEEALDPVLDLIVQGKLKIEDLPKRFEEKLGLSPEKARKLALDFARVLLVPLSNLLPEVGRTLAALGIKTSSASALVERHASAVSANAFVRGELEKYKLELPEEHLQKKFELALSEFVAKRKTREGTLEMLTRPRKVGGLELDPYASARLLEGLLDDSKHVSAGDSGVAGRLPPSTKHLPSSQPKPKPLPPRTVVKFDPVTIHADDEKDIEAHKEKVPSVEPLHDIEMATQKTMQAIDATGALDEEGKKKLHAIVKTRLNGLRDAYKTRAALEAVEGLGWSGGGLTQAIEAIEKTFVELEASGEEKAQREKREYVAKRAARFTLGTTEEEGMPAKAPLTSGSAGKLPPKFGTATSPNGRGHLVGRGSPNLTATSKTSGALSRVPREIPIPLPRSASSKVRDVAAPRKLSGPVEELAVMTIADFRRLGSTGEEAAEEIQERFQLLEEQSYAVRLKGVSAWRRSPLYETYVSIISEALQGGLGLEAVLRVHADAGEEMFKLEEIKALVKLNGMLRG